MSLRDTLKKNLPADLQTQVFDALGDDFDYDVVPRSRLNKVIGQRNDLKNQLNQLNTKGADNSDDDDDGDNNTEPSGIDLKKFVSKKDHEKELQDLKDAHAAELESVRKNYVAMEKLRAKGAVDPDTILKSGLLDMKDMTFGDDGTLSGIDDAIEQLVKDKAYFFSDSDSSHQRGTGKGGEDDKGDGSDVDTKLDAIFSRFAPTTDTNE